MSHPHADAALAEKLAPKRKNSQANEAPEGPTIADSLVPSDTMPSTSSSLSDSSSTAKKKRSSSRIANRVLEQQMKSKATSCKEEQENRNEENKNVCNKSMDTTKVADGAAGVSKAIAAVSLRERLRNIPDYSKANCSRQPLSPFQVRCIVKLCP